MKHTSPAMIKGEFFHTTSSRLNTETGKARRLKTALALLLLWFMPATVAAGSKPQEEELIIQGENYLNSDHYKEAIHSFMEAETIAESKGNKSIQCLAAYDMGVVYMTILEYGNAMSNFRRAYELCIRNKLSKKRELEIISAISGVYFNQGDYTRSKEELEKGMIVAEEINDSLMISTIAINIALVSTKINELGNIDSLLEKGLRFAPDLDASIIRVNAIRTEKAYLEKNMAETRRLALSFLQDTTTTEFKDIMHIYLMGAANHEGDWQEAIRIAQSPGRPEITLYNKPFYFRTLAESYVLAGDYRKALAAKDSLIIYTDSLEAISNNKLIENNKAAIEVLKYQLETDLQFAENKSATTRWILMAILFLLLFILAIITIFFQRRRNQAKQEMIRMQLENEQREIAMAQERMKEAEEVARMQQEMLQKEIEHKNNEMQANAMYISSREEMLRNMIKSLTSMKGAAENSEIRRLTRQLTRMLNNSNKDHEEFLTNFEAADPEFCRKLLESHPALIQSDVRFLSYIRMDMSMKQIATILNINPDSCKRRKIRISKKLGLESSADLYPYLLKL